jgi:hypothetical protein
MTNLSSSVFVACGRRASLRGYFTTAIAAPSVNGPLMIAVGWGRDTVLWPLIAATVG